MSIRKAEIGGFFVEEGWNIQPPIDCGDLSAIWFVFPE
jgi:hypothetical protein